MNDVELTDHFLLQGEELGLEQAEQIKSAGIRLIDAAADPMTVDLSGLEKANSVTVAVLVSWYRHATLLQKSIMFVNLSRELHNIIEFSGLSRVLLPTSSSQ